MLTSKKINELIDTVNNLKENDIMEIKHLFKQYCEIENSSCSSYIEKIMYEHKDRVKYVITEKIHGSNLGYYINLKTLDTYFASRTRLILDEDNSMRLIAESVMRKIKPNIQRLLLNAKNELKEELDQYDVLCVFGELFGGMYPHDDVPVDNKATRIQKGVYYTPSNYFNAFDIALLREKNKDELDAMDNRINEYNEELNSCTDEARINIIKSNIKTLWNTKKNPTLKYVDFDVFQKILEGTNIPIVPILKIVDSLQEALQFNKVFESEVYKQFDLPKIENNFAEGVVIKPIKEDYLYNKNRVIIKNKNDAFSEIVHGAQERKVEKIINRSQETTNLINLLDNYINDNRLDSVLSKIPGPYSDKDFGKIMKAFSVDILNDFKKYNEDKIEVVKDLDEYKLFTKALSNKASIKLRERFVDLISQQKYSA